VADEEDTFPTRVGKRLAPFDPDGSGYDEATGAELVELMPLTRNRPMTKPAGPVPEEFNEGDFQSWVWHPEENDWALHKGSIDPRTGMLLKGMQHPTIQEAKEYEASQGREFVKREDGRYYVQDKKK